MIIQFSSQTLFNLLTGTANDDWVAIDILMEALITAGFLTRVY